VVLGAIANDAGENATGNDGSPVSHKYIDLTAYETNNLTVNESGYLYCFPNDAWSLYGNNHGSIQLTITRQALKLDILLLVIWMYNQKKMPSLFWLLYYSITKE